MSAHLCHAAGCDVEVPPRMFMCKKHWYVVPKTMRDAIWAAYVPGQERRKDPSIEYLDAAIAAVRYVSDLEARQKIPF